MTINQRLPNARGQADQGSSTDYGTVLGNPDNFVLDVQHTLSEQIPFWRVLSIINEHASRMPLDNLSGLHAKKDKLLWRGQYRKLPLVCNQELELFLSRKYFLSPVDVAASGNEFKSTSSSRGSPSIFCRRSHWRVSSSRNSKS